MGILELDSMLSTGSKAAHTPQHGAYQMEPTVLQSKTTLHHMVIIVCLITNQSKVYKGQIGH